MAELAGEKPAPALRRRDVRLLALGLTVAAVLIGGLVLEWSGRRSEAENRRQHAREQRAAEIDTRFKQGVIMLHTKQFDHAVAAFHRVIELAPKMPEAHVNLGFALLGRKDYKAALDFFHSATELKQDQLNAYFGMAECYEALGNLRAALESMETYLHLTKPDDPYRRRAEAAVWEWREKLAKMRAQSPPAPK